MQIKLLQNIIYFIKVIPKPKIFKFESDLSDFLFLKCLFGILGVFIYLHYP